MNNKELSNLIKETTEEILSKNHALLDESEILRDEVELAVQLSCLTNIKLLQKLGVIEKTTD